MRRTIGFVWLCVLCLPACGDPKDSPLPEPAPEPLAPLDIPAGCNPLGADWDCLLPFPSDVFLSSDEAMPSGRRVVFGDAGPKDSAGAPIDITTVHPADGFSVAPPILVRFPKGVAPAGLVSHTGDTSVSLGAQSATVVMEADTGARVLHFAEIDPRPEDPARRALIIRPMVRLDHDTRYIVALRGLKAPDGSAIEPPEGFRRLRDAEALGDPVLEPLAARYEVEIFPALDAAQVERAGLLLAWDFTTESLENAAGDLLTLRQDAMARMEATPPDVVVTEVEDEEEGATARRVEGFLTVPLYLESVEPNARIHRDAQGVPVANGQAQVPFTLLIPRSVMEGERPARLLQFGHGFLGGREEMESGVIFELVDQMEMVVIGVDWWGMSEPDIFPLGEKLTQAPSEALVFTDRLHQAMVNFMAVTYAARAGLLDADGLRRDNGEAFYDPEQISFYGISQGHILGGTYMALSPHIRRGVLGVGGASFTLMMFRALPFEPFIFLVELQIEDALEQQKWAAMVQTGFDRIDPITYAPFVLQEPLPGAPTERRVLMQLGIGDTSVPNLAGHLHARALGLSHLQPAPRVVQGLDPVEAPFSGSALAEYSFGIDPLPGIEADFAEEANAVHESVRRTPAAIRQIDAFLRSGGEIEHECEGPCDPE